ncbi:MAG: hypothetical protein HYU36_22465 [Planctomycetes bacterium]|nr:hypothetical protein [Planctomycetota bacterium]
MRYRRLVLTGVLLALLATVISVSKAIPGPGDVTPSPPPNDLLPSDPVALQNQLDRDVKTLLDVLDGLDDLAGRASSQVGKLGESDSKVYSQSENDLIRSLLLAYLNYRTVLFRIVDRYQNYAAIPDPDLRLEAFIIGYAAGLSLFEKGLSFIQWFEGNDRAIRKLNEGDLTWGVPAKVYSTVRANLSKSRHIKILRDARVTYESLAGQAALPPGPSQARIERLRQHIGNLHEALARRPFHPWDYRFQNLLDRAKSGADRPVYRVQSWISTLIGDTKLPVRRGRRSLITLDQVQQMKERLQPGDIIIERRNWFLSNAFLPGFWPHAALYVGNAEDIQRLGLDSNTFVQNKLEDFRKLAPDGHEHRVIEALSEGVVFSSLEEATLADYIAVLRPRVAQERVRQAIASAFSHLGKPYDFEFDFFTTDKLVCTELVYRCYDGGVQFGLVDVLGRRTLPAIEIVKKFAREYSSPESQLEFVLFLDGDEKQGNAHFASPEDLIQSALRSGFTWLN